MIGLSPFTDSVSSPSLAAPTSTLNPHRSAPRSSGKVPTKFGLKMTQPAATMSELGISFWVRSTCSSELCSAPTALRMGRR
jgi:hypothetical protein